MYDKRELQSKSIRPYSQGLILFACKRVILHTLSMISTRSLPTAHVFFTLWCYVYYGYEEIVHTSQVRQTMNYEPLSNTTPAYPYNNFSPYPQVPFIATPPPPEQRRQRPSLLKIFFAIIFMLVLMAFSGLGG